MCQLGQCLLSLDFCPDLTHTTFVHTKRTQMFDEMWSEIQDMPGEIFDIEEWGHPLAECWHDMELNQPENDDNA